MKDWWNDTDQGKTNYWEINSICHKSHVEW